MRDRTSTSPCFVRVRTSGGKDAMVSRRQRGDREKPRPSSGSGSSRGPIPGGRADRFPPAPRRGGNPILRDPRSGGETMSQNYQATGRVAVANLAGKHAYELLLLLGSALALLLSVVLYLIQWSQGIAANQLSAVTTVFVVDVVLGSALWLSAMIVRKDLANGALMAGVGGRC